MDKIWIIIKREYLNLVTKKSFLIATFLVPILFGGFIFLEVYVLSLDESEPTTAYIAQDDVSIFSGDYRLIPETDLDFKVVDLPKDSLIKKLTLDKNALILKLPSQESIDNRKQGNLVITGRTTISEGVLSSVKKKVQSSVEKYRTQKAGVTPEQLEQMEFDLTTRTKKVNKEGKVESSNTFLASAIGMGIAMITFMMVFIYGNILMQGVIEEKANRIVEIIVSSVRPFKLLMGKVIGLAGVGLTQMLLWGILLGLLYAFVLIPMMAGTINPEALQSGATGAEVAGMEDKIQDVFNSLETFDWGVLWFVPFFFIGGFLLYGSLFAAVGSAVDNVQDAQQLVAPLQVPIMLGFLAVLYTIRNPDTPMAVGASLFPFFTPMVMPTRMAILGISGVGWFQIVLSLVFLVLGFLACVWLAAKIYQTGILMYGKKPSFKEIFRWIRA